MLWIVILVFGVCSELMCIWFSLWFVCMKIFYSGYIF